MKSVALPAATLVLCAMLLSVRAAPIRAQAPVPASGETLFKQRCAMCHAVAGKGGKMGPDLTGVLGRRAGTAAFAYSPAMKGARTIWNAKTLDAYLAAPAKAIPGTRMVVAVSDPAQRRTIIAYLASAR